MEQTEGSCMPAATRDSCTSVESSEPKEQAEGSSLRAATRDGCTPVDGSEGAKAFPTEASLPQMERHKERKEAGFEKHAYKQQTVVEQHFDDCGDYLGSITDPQQLNILTELQDETSSDDFGASRSPNKSQHQGTARSKPLSSAVFLVPTQIPNFFQNADGRIEQPTWKSSCLC